MRGFAQSIPATNGRTEDCRAAIVAALVSSKVVSSKVVSSKVVSSKVVSSNLQGVKGVTMPLLKRIFARATGNYVIQKLLEENIRTTQYFMGIGSGHTTQSSGEHAVFRALEKRFEPPYCIFDIGANTGQFLGLAKRTIRAEDYAIHCFEPGTATFQTLSDSAELDDRVKLNRSAIGKSRGEAVLHSDSAQSQLASLTKRNLDHCGIDFNRSEVVSVETIDNYCADNGIDHIHLLKIDIEGHELDALAGAESMLNAKEIDIITFEFGGCNIDTRTYFQDFWYFFERLNLSLFRMTPSGYLFPIRKYKELHEQFRTVNYIAMPRG